MQYSSAPCSDDGNTSCAVSIQRESVYQTMLTQQHCNPAQIKRPLFKVIFSAI